MLFMPCEICTKPINEKEAEQSLIFTEKIIGEGRILCASCRHNSDVIVSIIKGDILYG